MPVRPEQIKIRRRDTCRQGRRKSRFRLRILLAALVLLGGYWGYRWVVNRPQILAQRLVILGFEGADLRLIEKHWEDLPNLQWLAEVGHMGKLATVFPPEAMVAWSSFAVGAGPGVHGIFGFLRRPRGTYLIFPDSFVSREDPKFFRSYIATTQARFALNRAADAFWDVTSQYRIPAVLIRVPATFPAPKTPFVTCLCGSSPVDITGNRIVFHHFSTKYRGEVEETNMGGKLVPLSQEGGWYRGIVAGPLNLLVKNKIKSFKDRRFNVQLKRMEAQLALWLRDRTSPTILSDRERYWLALAYIAADLRPESEAMREKHLATVRRLQAVLTDPEGPEAAKLLAKANRTSEADLRRRLENFEEEEDALLEQQRALEENRGLPPSITAGIGFQPVNKHSVTVDFGGKQDIIYLEKWSHWFDITFRIAPLLRIHGVTRFYLQSATPELEVFMHSIQMDPRRPPVPVSHPGGFARELVESGSPEIGIFETSGWAAETHGLIDEKLDEKAFMEDLMELARTRESITFHTYQNKQFNLFVSVFSSTDRVAHVMYRLIDPRHPGYDADLAAEFGDAVKKVYIHMDRVVGKMLDLIDEDTVLFVVSGHGFRPYRYTVNLNTWLVEQGYMKLKEMRDRSDVHGLQQLAIGRFFFDAVDWSQTKAYSLGPGQVYINLRGREPEGIVDPSEYDAVCADIRASLLSLTDNRLGHYGDPVVRRVAVRREIWEGPFVGETSDAPDIQVGFEDGYHIGWQTWLGGVPPKVIEDNTDKWSGDHSCVSPELVPGVLFCNRPIRATAPSIIDLAPTVLDYFDLPGGENLLQLTAR